MRFRDPNIKPCRCNWVSHSSDGVQSIPFEVDLKYRSEPTQANIAILYSYIHCPSNVSASRSSFPLRYRHWKQKRGALVVNFRFRHLPIMGERLSRRTPCPGLLSSKIFASIPYSLSRAYVACGEHTFYGARRFSRGGSVDSSNER